jgi:hypothetical protein
MWTNWHLIRELVGASGLKKGAAGAVGDLSSAEKDETNQTSQVQPLEKK